MNNQIIPYDDLVVWFSLDPDSEDTKPHVVRSLLEKNKIHYFSGKGNKPCTTIQALNKLTPEESNDSDNVIEVVKLD